MLKGQNRWKQYNNIYNIPKFCHTIARRLKFQMCVVFGTHEWPQQKWIMLLELFNKVFMDIFDFSFFLLCNLVIIGIHCNSCKSKLTTAAALNIGARYTLFKAIFQASRQWVFGTSKINLESITVSSWQYNEHVHELLPQVLHSYQAEWCTGWWDQWVWSVWSSGWRLAGPQWRVCWSLPIRSARAELYCAG